MHTRAEYARAIRAIYDSKGYCEEAGREGLLRCFRYNSTAMKGYITLYLTPDYWTYESGPLFSTLQTRNRSACAATESILKVFPF